MSYRDDLQAAVSRAEAADRELRAARREQQVDRERIGRLERELQAARAGIAELSRRAAEAPGSGAGAGEDPLGPGRVQRRELKSNTGLGLSLSIAIAMGVVAFMRASRDTPKWEPPPTFNFTPPPRLPDTGWTTYQPYDPYRAPSRTPASESAESVDERFNALLRAGVDAAQQGDHETALMAAELALALKPGNQEALALAGLEACHVKDAAKAQQYAPQVQGARQKEIRAVCKKKGVKL